MENFVASGITIDVTAKRELCCPNHTAASNSRAARWVAHLANRRRDRGLTPREQSMARTAIHPGQHLAELLKELGMSAAELGRASRSRPTGSPES